MEPIAYGRAYLQKKYKKDQAYSFVVTKERNAVGCQIVRDSNGGRHLLTGTREVFPTGKRMRCIVRGYSHHPSEITSSHYLVLNPAPPKKEEEKAVRSRPEPFIELKESTASEFDPKIQASLRKQYKIGERYQFVVTKRRDNAGNQIVQDRSGILHILSGTTSSYAAGDNVKCTVVSHSIAPSPATKNHYLSLSSPRVIRKVEEFVRYVKSPEKWHAEVQDLGRHKCGKPFKCNCCGRTFPANAGWRVDQKEIYFCNSCARKIYEPTGRGNSRFIISTPMGNKR